MKKIWEKPKLTVLVRGRPEENVLIACKTFGAELWGVPNDDLKGCKYGVGPCTKCSEASLAPS